MKKRNHLGNWMLILVGFVLAVLIYCLFFAREIIIEEALFLVLALFASLVLSNLLLTWTILISFGLGIVFLVAGVVYIPANQGLFLLFSFPILIGMLSKIRYYLFKEVAKVQNQEEDAEVAYRGLLEHSGVQQEQKLQALLIHWSHEELFYQIHPREYNRTLNQIHYLIGHHLIQDERLYYVSDGNFLVLTNSQLRNLQDYYQLYLKNQLESLVFKGEDGNQAIQFQKGYLVVDSTNRTKFHSYQEAISNLKRQLETDIIVEY